MADMPSTTPPMAPTPYLHSRIMAGVSRGLDALERVIDIEADIEASPTLEDELRLGDSQSGFVAAAGLAFALAADLADTLPGASWCGALARNLHRLVLASCAEDSLLQADTMAEELPGNAAPLALRATQVAASFAALMAAPDNNPCPHDEISFSA